MLYLFHKNKNYIKSVKHFSIKSNQIIFMSHYYKHHNSKMHRQQAMDYDNERVIILRK